MWSAALCTLGVTKPVWAGCNCLNYNNRHGAPTVNNVFYLIILSVYETVKRSQCYVILKQ